MSRAPKLSASFTYVEDGPTQTPPRLPADGFRLYIGTIGKDWTTVDPLAAPSMDLGLLPDDGAGLRNFDSEDVPAILSVPAGTYSAAVAAYILGTDGKPSAFSDFAVAPTVPLDFRAPGAPVNLVFVRA
jgi:hypothetical protein